MSKNKAAAVNSNTATIEAAAAAEATLTVQQQIDAAVAAALAALPQAKPKATHPRDKMYIAGMCVAKYGYTDAINNAMINFINEAYYGPGKGNDATSLANLKAARAAVAAYVAETTPAAVK